LPFKHTGESEEVFTQGRKKEIGVFPHREIAGEFFFIYHETFDASFGMD